MHVAILQSSPACETPLGPVDLRLSDWPISLFNLLARSVTFGSDLPEPGLSPLIPYPICPGYDLTWADLGPAATASGRYTIPRSASHSPPIVVIAHDPGISLLPTLRQLATCKSYKFKIAKSGGYSLAFFFAAAASRSSSASLYSRSIWISSTRVIAASGIFNSG